MTRQRSKAFQIPQGKKDLAQKLADPQRGRNCHFRIGQWLLQSAPPTFSLGVKKPCGLRTQGRLTYAPDQNKTGTGPVCQVERMNRTIKDATVKRFPYDDQNQLRNHLANFISAYNFGRRLKTLKGLTPYEFICKQGTIEAKRYTLNPIYQMPGLNI